MAKDPYKYFRIEARELLDSISQGVMGLEKEAPGKEPLAKVLRYAHTLKGAARVVKQPEMAERAHKIEEVLAPYRDGTSAVPREAITQILSHLDDIGNKLAALGGSEESNIVAPVPLPSQQLKPAAEQKRREPAEPAAHPMRRATDF